MRRSFSKSLKKVVVRELPCSFSALLCPRLQPEVPVLPPSVFAVQGVWQSEAGSVWGLVASSCLDSVWPRFGHGLVGWEIAPFSTYANVSCSIRLCSEDTVSQEANRAHFQVVMRAGTSFWQVVNVNHREECGV